MKIVEFEIKGYNRFGLSGIKTLKLNCESQIQLILGSNGSGKSSLLKELNPLPVQSSDFTDGGFKRIVLEHRGHRYVSLSEINGKSVKHSLWKDDTVLCEKAIGSTHRELVEKELNYTAKTHQFITQAVSFTAMTPSTRQNAFSELIKDNLIETMAVYNNARSGLRMTQGALAHVNNKIIDITKRIESQTVNEDDVKERIDYHQSCINLLFPISTNSDINLETLREQFIENRRSLTSQLAATDKLSFKRRTSHSRAETKQRYDESTDALNVLKGKLETIGDQLERASSNKRLLEESIDGKNKLEARLSKLTSEIDSFSYPFLSKEFEAIMEDDVSILLDALSSTSAGTIYYSSEEHDNNKSAVEQLTATLDKLRGQYRSLEAELKFGVNLREQSLECQNCGTEVLPPEAISKDDEPKHRVWMTTLAQEIETIQDRLAIARERLEESQAFRFNVEHLRKTLSRLHSFPTIRTYLKSFSIASADDCIKQISHTSVALIRLKEALESIKKYKEQLKEKEDIEKTLEESNRVLEALSEEDDGKLKEHYDGLLRSHETTLETRNSLHYDMQQYNRIEKLYAQINDQLANAEASASKYANGAIVDEINSELKDHQLKLASLTQQLQSVSNLRRSLDELEEDKKVLLFKKELYEKSESIMSPKTGIIAKQLSGFIEGFIAVINNIIHKVWEYDLTIKMCSKNGTDMDYKFPLVVNGDVIGDIGLASQGQKDVIDFAFTLALLTYTKLNDYPLFLDEVGASFDDKHRVKFMDFIKLAVTRGHCSQLFMINHYSTEYGGLTNTDTVVLDSKNISLPENFNRNAKIEY